MKKILCVVFIPAIVSSMTCAQPPASVLEAAARTEIWEPQPRVVTPAATLADAPSDAIVLFDGDDLDQWCSANDSSKSAPWIVHDGIFTVKKGSGNIQTKQSFADYQLHIEWRIPGDLQDEGQARGNSGIFLASTGKGDEGYEIQILDNYNNKTYSNGQSGSVYKQTPPLINASKPPGEWQSYDIVWTAPRFDANGTLLSPARVTLLHNGILVQNNTEVKGRTRWIGSPSYKAHGPAPIKLQDHNDPSKPISFRNIWLRVL